jgi:type IV pilus assembly protein PilA
MLQSVLRRLREAQTVELESGGTAESGFTLIELMVVLLIIAILLAIAIPTFLGVTGSANDRAAQSNLTNGLTEASAVYQSNNQNYTGIQAALTTSAPEFSWQAAGATPTAGSNQLGVLAVDVATSGDTQGVVIAANSKTATCWWVAQLVATPAVVASTGFIQHAAGAAGAQMVGGVNISKAGTYYAKSTTSGVCQANWIETKVGGFSWGSSYSSAPLD